MSWAESQLEGWIVGQAKMPDRTLLVLAGVLDSWAARRKLNR